MKEDEFLAEIRGILEQGKTSPERDEFLGGKYGMNAFGLPTGTVFAPLERKTPQIQHGTRIYICVESDPTDPMYSPVNIAMSQVEWVRKLYIRQRLARLPYETASKFHKLRDEINTFRKAVGGIDLIPSEWRVLENYLNGSGSPGYRWNTLNPRPPEEVQDLSLPFLWMNVIGCAAGQAAEEFQSRKTRKSSGPAPRPAKKLGVTPEYDLVVVAWFLAYRFDGPPSLNVDGTFLKILANIVELVYLMPEVCNQAGESKEQPEKVRFQMSRKRTGLAKNLTVMDVHRYWKTRMKDRLDSRRKEASQKAKNDHWAKDELVRFEVAEQPGRRPGKQESNQ
ncbi:MAG: hypothetical protein IPP78_08495 [Holophagaceae bacterium]|nr:hypothetical protein [Holophagaceae bacterium]